MSSDYKTSENTGIKARKKQQRMIDRIKKSYAKQINRCKIKISDLRNKILEEEEHIKIMQSTDWDQL